MKKCLLYLTLCLLLAPIHGGANTTRDLGPEPAINGDAVGRWILFYVNLERASRNLHPLAQDPALEKAARWQADYCAKLGDLTHAAKEPSMATPGKRISRFGARWKTSGENVGMEFAITMADRKYSIEKDDKGEYLNFYDHAVRWYDERNLARSIVEGWMKNPGQKGHLLREGFFSTGVAVQKGAYGRHGAYFACQVYTNNMTYDFSKVSIEGPGGPDKKQYRITHGGTLPVHVIEIRKNLDAVVCATAREGKTCVFERPPGERKYFVCLHDREKGIFYPLKPI